MSVLSSVWVLVVYCCLILQTEPVVYAVFLSVASSHEFILLSSFQAAWDFCTFMASAAPPKRVVSSVFITLASPHRATVTPQQQPALQAHSAPAREKLHPAVRVSPGDSIPALRHSREDKSPPSESYGGLKSKGLTNAGSSALVSGPQSHNPPKREPGKTQLQEKNDQRSSSGIYYILVFFFHS